MTYQHFFDNCRGLASLSAACSGRDIAVIRVAQPSGEGFPGALGFAPFSDGTIKATTSYNKGYPNCGGTGDPDAAGGSASSPNNVCRSNTLYGSTGTIDSTTESGRRTTFNMDTSPGMSGSSLYIYDSVGAKVYGVDSTAQSCYKGCTTAFPTYAARVTSTYYGWIFTFMGI